MNSFETFSYNSLYSLEVGSFGCPISAWAWSILFSSKNDSLNVAFDVPLGCIEDIESLTSGDMNSLRTHCSFHHLVDYSNISKRSSCHDQVIASPRTICIEISLFDSPLLQKSSCWRWHWYIACRWDVICGDGISEDCQNVGTVDRFDFGESLFCCFEERRIVDVGWFLIPVEVDWLLDW